MERTRRSSEFDANESLARRLRNVTEETAPRFDATAQDMQAAEREIVGRILRERFARRFAID